MEWQVSTSRFHPNNKQYYAIITEAHKKDKEGEEIKNLRIQIFQ